MSLGCWALIELSEGLFYPYGCIYGAKMLASSYELFSSVVLRLLMTFMTSLLNFPLTLDVWGLLAASQFLNVKTGPSGEKVAQIR